MTKQITLKQIGYVIGGTAILKLWGGDTGEIEMNKWTIMGTLTKSKLLAGINDGRFGCETILGAQVEIYELYENGYKQFLDTIEIPGKRCMQAQRGI